MIDWVVFVVSLRGWLFHYEWG